MNLLFLDTETGGLDPYKNAILQVGAIAEVDGEVLGTIQFYTKFDDSRFAVTAKALEVNGIDLGIVRLEGITTAEAAAELNCFAAKHFKEKPTLVGHNPSIDKYMLRHQVYGANGLEMDNFISHRMIDTMSLLSGLHIVGKLPAEACSSSGAFKYFGINVNGRHTALGDAEATRELFHKIIKMLKS